MKEDDEIVCTAQFAIKKTNAIGAREVALLYRKLFGALLTLEITIIVNRSNGTLICRKKSLRRIIVYTGGSRAGIEED
jgi:hypothetical protein